MTPQLVCFCGNRTVLRHARCQCEGSCGCGMTRCDRCAGRVDPGALLAKVREWIESGHIAGKLFGDADIVAMIDAAIGADEMREAA